MSIPCCKNIFIKFFVKLLTFDLICGIILRIHGNILLLCCFSLMLRFLFCTQEMSVRFIQTAPNIAESQGRGGPHKPVLEGSSPSSATNKIFCKGKSWHLLIILTQRNAILLYEVLKLKQTNPGQTSKNLKLFRVGCCLVILL